MHRFVWESRSSRKVAWMVFLIWIVSVSSLLWVFFHDNKRDFLSEKRLPDTENLSLSNVDSPLTFVHFTDKACSCSRFSEPHVRDLEQQFSTFHHIRVDPSLKTADLGEADRRLVAQLAVSSPSVAIFGRNGKLHYLGPYSAGAICGDGDDLVEQVVHSVGDEPDYHWMNVLAFGCFCEWPDKQLNSALSFTNKNYVEI